MRIRVHNYRRFFGACAIAIIGAIVFLAGMDAITDHEVIPGLPDCEEDEVLTFVVYDQDEPLREYECLHSERLGE